MTCGTDRLTDRSTQWACCTDGVKSYFRLVDHPTLLLTSWHWLLILGPWLLLLGTGLQPFHWRACRAIRNHSSVSGFLLHLSLSTKVSHLYRPVLSFPLWLLSTVSLAPVVWCLPVYIPTWHWHTKFHGNVVHDNDAPITRLVRPNLDE